MLVFLFLLFYLDNLRVEDGRRVVDVEQDISFPSYNDNSLTRGNGLFYRLLGSWQQFIHPDTKTSYTQQLNFPELFDEQNMDLPSNRLSVPNLLVSPPHPSKPPGLQALDSLDLGLEVTQTQPQQQRVNSVIRFLPPPQVSQDRLIQSLSVYQRK